MGKRAKEVLKRGNADLLIWGEDYYPDSKETPFRTDTFSVRRCEESPERGVAREVFDNALLEGRRT